MTQTFHYSSPTTPYAASWDVDLGTSAIRLGDIPGWAAAAENGDVASCGVAIDDPDGMAGHEGDAILGLKTFWVTEDDCAAVGADGVDGQRLWTGYITDRTYRRGNSAPASSLVLGAARRIDIDLIDLNALAAFRVISRKSTVLTGTVAKNGTTAVVGTSTLFLTELRVGSTVSIPGGGGVDVLYVASIADDTHFTATAAATHTASGQVGTRIDGDRPAETDVQRIRWLISGVPAWLPVTDDAGWFDTSGPVNMDANDYTGDSAADVAHDCALASAKNWWIGFWEASGTDSFWYRDSTTSTLYTSLLSLSDILSDVDLVTTFPPMPGARLVRSPVHTYAGLYEPYTSGYVYVEQPSTANTYAWRDGTAPNQNVKTSVKATAIATRLLGDASGEDDRIFCRVQLPSSLATGIKAGQRMLFRSSWMPGYDPARYVRVARCTVAQDEETDKRYTLTLELVPMAQPPTCPTSLSGTIFAADSQDTDFSSPVSPQPSATITPVAGRACVIFAATGTDGASTNPPLSAGTAMTDIGVGRQGISHTFMFVSYRAIGSPAGSYAAANVLGENQNVWAHSVVALLTSSVTPVQVTSPGFATDSVPITATLASPPTPGNILLWFYVSNHAVVSPPDESEPDPAGTWTLVGQETGLGGFGVQSAIWARCVQPGDGQSWGGPFAGDHGVILAEWAIT